MPLLSVLISRCYWSDFTRTKIALLRCWELPTMWWTKWCRSSGIISPGGGRSASKLLYFLGFFSNSQFHDRAYWIVSRCMMRRQLLRTSRNINSKKKIVWYCKSPQDAVSAKQWGDVTGVLGAWWLGLTCFIYRYWPKFNETTSLFQTSPVQTTGVY